MSRQRFLPAVAAVAIATAPATAFGNVGAHQYANPARGEQAPAAAGPVGAAQGNGGTLPFTGLDLTLAVAGGGLLVISGAVVRRLLRKHGS